MPLINRIVISNGNKKHKERANLAITAMDRHKVANWTHQLQAEVDDKAARRSLYRAEDWVKDPDKANKLNTCKICGDYLTTSEKYAGRRCLDPGHWQAAGLLAATDSYFLARIVAEARAEHRRYREVQCSEQKHRLRHLLVVQAEWQRFGSLKLVSWRNIFGEKDRSQIKRAIGSFFTNCLRQLANKPGFPRVESRGYSLITIRSKV